jgi:hypothetical protein
MDDPRLPWRQNAVITLTGVILVDLALIAFTLIRPGLSDAFAVATVLVAGATILACLIRLPSVIRINRAWSQAMGDLHRLHAAYPDLVPRPAGFTRPCDTPPAEPGTRPSPPCPSPSSPTRPGSDPVGSAPEDSAAPPRGLR